MTEWDDSDRFWQKKRSSLVNYRFHSIHATSSISTCTHEAKYARNVDRFGQIKSSVENLPAYRLDFFAHQLLNVVDSRIISSSFCFENSPLRKIFERVSTTFDPGLILCIREESNDNLLHFLRSCRPTAEQKCTVLQVPGFVWPRQRHTARSLLFRSSSPSQPKLSQYFCTRCC
jgi:hypothetical protein